MNKTLKLWIAFNISAVFLSLAEGVEFLIFLAYPRNYFLILLLCFSWVAWLIITCYVFSLWRESRGGLL